MGNLGSFSSPHTDFKFNIDTPHTRLRLVLPDIPLLVGGYNLTLNLYGPEVSDFLDRRSPAASFRIVGPPTDAFGYGVGETLLFNHRWEGQ